MKNLFKYMLISSFLCYASNAFMQSNKVLYHYKGAASINTVNITDNVVLTFDRKIVGSYKVTGTGFYNTNIKSDEILNNKLSNVSRSIPNLSNVTFSVSDIAALVSTKKN